MFERLTTDPEVCNGIPCIRGMRFPVYQVIDLITSGNSFDKILADYPDLEKNDLEEAIVYAKKLTGL